MFLVGDFSDRTFFDFKLKIKSSISNEDLIDVKYNDDFQIIDIKNKTYFDPETNSWTEIDEV